METWDYYKWYLWRFFKEENIVKWKITLSNYVYSLALCNNWAVSVQWSINLSRLTSWTDSITFWLLSGFEVEPSFKTLVSFLIPLPFLPRVVGVGEAVQLAMVGGSEVGRPHWPSSGLTGSCLMPVPWRRSWSPKQVECGSLGIMLRFARPLCCCEEESRLPSGRPAVHPPSIFFG